MPSDTANTRTIPKLDHKLSGQETMQNGYFLEMFLTMYEIDEYTIWDIVTGAYQKPTSSTTTKYETEAGSSKLITARKEWVKANYFAILTMKKNYKTEVVSRFGLSKTVKEECDEL
jgi:hypothetical protein